MKPHLLLELSTNKTYFERLTGALDGRCFRSDFSVMITWYFSGPSPSSWLFLGVAGSQSVGSAMNFASILGFPEVPRLTAEAGRRVQYL